MADYVSTTYQMVEYRFDGTNYARARISGKNFKPVEAFYRTYEDNVPLVALSELRQQWAEKWGKPVSGDTVIVTRHAALVDHLRNLGLATADTPVYSHVAVKEVKGKHVIGVLPLHLAAEAASITEVPMNIPARLRGVELSLAEVRQFAKPPVRYTVRRDHE